MELAKIAGYMHDIGNVINRIDHAQSGAVMAFRILDKMGMDPEDVAVVITAIGNHDEHTAYPVNGVAAALILADKTDVRRSGCATRTPSPLISTTGSIMRRSIPRSRWTPERHTLTLTLSINTDVCAVMDYFEIFLDRMLLCRKAAEFFGLKFKLDINGSLFSDPRLSSAPVRRLRRPGRSCACGLLPQYLVFLSGHSIQSLVE